MRKKLNIEKFSKLGWKAKIKLDDGIAQTVLKLKEEFH